MIRLKGAFGSLRERWCVANLSTVVTTTVVLTIAGCSAHTSATRDKPRPLRSGGSSSVTRITPAITLERGGLPGRSWARTRFAHTTLLPARISGSGTTSLLNLSTPEAIAVGSIGLDAPLERLDLAADRELIVPRDPDEVGWWQAPNQGGPIVVVGHVDSYTGPAAFFRLRKVRAGDVISIRFSRGVSRQFVVNDVQQVDKDNFPTRRVYRDDPSGIRLVTCGGEFDTKLRHYNDNLIVFASPRA